MRIAASPTSSELEDSMATRVDILPLSHFDPLGDQSSISQRWKSWMKRFETYYLVATNTTSDAQKRAMLLYQADVDTQDIFETLPETITIPSNRS